jgi:hypothetical protein
VSSARSFRIEPGGDERRHTTEPCSFSLSSLTSFIFILILLATLLVLVVMYVVDDAVRVLNARAGLPAAATVCAGASASCGSSSRSCSRSSSCLSEWFEPPPPQVATYGPDSLWTGADTTRLAYLPKEQRELMRYGRELIANTAHYLGPNGTVMQNTNALNCQNCHLDAGTRPWGNNYGAVWSTYPKMRARSGRTGDRGQAHQRLFGTQPERHRTGHHRA